MLTLSLGSIEYGNYISLTKFIIFAILFFAWLPIVNWVYRDAKVVRTKEMFWTLIFFSAGAVAAVIWLLTYFFIIGLLFYLIAVAATLLVYIMHRNAKVPTFERILTANHIKSLFINEQKQITALSKGLSFITANNNEVPIPQRKTPEFFGYKLANEIFHDAIWRRTETVTFLPVPEGYRTIYNIDGAIFKQPTKAREEMEYFIRFLKHLADLNVNEKRKPQRGKFRIRSNKTNIDWEVTTAGSTAGEQAQVRQIKQHSLLKLADLGLSASQLEKLNKIRDLQSGLFIIAGPKKSGVTTTFYTMLRNHDPFLHNINTLERQPSAELANITQNIYSLSDTGTMSYAQKLQTILQNNPDIIGVSDCQDAETASILCSVARKGKLVYVTLEAPNVVEALGKWIKLLGDKDLVAETLVGIVAQRLLRKLCSKCRQPYEPNIELLRKFNIPAEKVKLFYRQAETRRDKRGKSVLCENCQGTGFFGRTAVMEIILINDELRKTIKESKTLSDIGTQFRLTKMLYMQEQALRKVIGGTTAINEVIRVFSTPKKRKVRKRRQ